MVGLMLTIGSLLFIMMLMVIYFSKQRFLSMKNKIYRYMLITTIVIAVTEIIATLAAMYSNNDFLVLFLYKIHWITGIVWFSLLYYYSKCFLNDIKVNNLFDLIKENKSIKIATIFFIIAFLVYFLIPFEAIDRENIIYLPKYVAYYVYGFCSISVLLISIATLRNAKNVLLRKKIAIWIMIVELIAIFVLQLAFPLIAMSPIGAAVQMFFLYFSIENPDLKIIEELEQVKQDIDRANRAKTDFLSNMSHEIRTPMNAIVGFSETLLNDQNFDQVKAKSDIKHIFNAGNNLLDIINNILDISKIESGKEVLENKEYFLANIIMELASIIEARLGNSSVKLIIDVNKSLPSKLYGDATKVFQILLNILTNSVKYTEVGKIKLTVNGKVENDFINLSFKVSDTGYGIKKEDFDKLFEKFSRLDNATTNEIEGTGLGLVITKRYVDLMDGKIWFESEYEVGTTFYVDIKQRIIDFNPIGEISEPVKQESEIDYIDCSKYKILIVDDNKLNIKVASRILQKYNFNIDTSQSGMDCLYKIKEGKEYDMIFMDHMMPEMDGIETMHALRKLDDYKIPPIVALTANAITGMKEMYLREGFDEYLSKPINIAELNKLIIKYFDN